MDRSRAIGSDYISLDGCEFSVWESRGGYFPDNPIEVRIPATAKYSQESSLGTLYQQRPGICPREHAPTHRKRKQRMGCTPGLAVNITPWTAIHHRQDGVSLTAGVWEGREGGGTIHSETVGHRRLPWLHELNTSHMFHVVAILKLRLAATNNYVLQPTIQ